MRQKSGEREEVKQSTMHIMRRGVERQGEKSVDGAAATRVQQACFARFTDPPTPTDIALRTNLEVWCEERWAGEEAWEGHVQRDLKVSRNIALRHLNVLNLSG